MRAALLSLLLALAWGPGFAQAPSQNSPKPAPELRGKLQKSEQLAGRQNQRIERIRVEDSGSRIDELRYGGETKSISVQPKADVPAYEMQPTDGARSRPADHRDGLSNATGQRVWNVFKF